MLRYELDLFEREEESSLEKACNEKKYNEAKELLSTMTFDVEMIERCLLQVIKNVSSPYEDDYNATFYDFHYAKFASIKPGEHQQALELIRSLAEKASTKCLIELLEKELFYETRAFHEFHQLPPDYRTDFHWYCLVKNKIDIYKACLNQRQALPIWIILFAGYSQEDSAFKILPYEVLKLIGISFYVHAYKIAIEKKNIAQLKAFKKIYSTLAELGFKNEQPSGDIHIAEECPQKFIPVIKGVAENIKWNSPPLLSLTKKSWSLTSQHYDDSRTIYIELEQIRQDKITFDVFKKILSCFVEHNCPISDIENDECLVKYFPLDRQKFSRGNDATKEKAYTLALKHCHYFSEKNDTLVNEMAGFIALKNGYARSFSHHDYMFTSTRFDTSHPMYSLIKKDVIEFMQGLDKQPEAPKLSLRF